jgi:phenylalanyl-tRNA synthetase beta chain
MKFSENWLRSMVDPGMSSPELAHVLTMAGLEVEARDAVAPVFDRVVVGRVVRVEAHPNADRLRVCAVDVGNEVLNIVCGAPNVRPDLKVACALVDANLPGGKIGRAKVRGIESNGMLCSAQELGLAESQDGLVELDDTAVVGENLRNHLDLDDWMLTLKLTPNRGDCLSIRGIARELGALTGNAPRGSTRASVPVAIPEERAIRLRAGSGCPRYCGRIIRELDVNAVTPTWMSRRLERAGVRPISAVVDITNYVMLELGQPLHAFDLERLEGEISVRFARPGERLLLLNGREVEFSASHMLIADDAGALALAGVMGGEPSSVTDQTQAVFLESAFFSPDVVAQGARALGLTSDASHRFERGVDFELAGEAIQRATELIVQVCGGKAGPVTEALGELPARKPIGLRMEKLCRVIGVEIGADEAITILKAHGLDVAALGETIRATPPSFRFDLAIEEDLIEEIARVHGYEHIPPSLPLVRTPMLPHDEAKLDPHRLKQALAARDYVEVVTFSFVDRSLEADFAGNSEPIAVANPIASQLSVMRSSLLGSLVECVRANVDHKQERVRVFEVAGCFRREGQAFRQVERVAGLCYGLAAPEQWGSAKRPVDFFDVRGDLEAVLGSDRLSLITQKHPAFHPGQSARVLVDGETAGWLGVLHPRWVQKYGLVSAPVGFEMDLARIQSLAVPAYSELSRFPPARRDVSFIVDESILIEALMATMRAAGGAKVIDIALFDIYRGRGVPDGRKSLAFRVLLQDTEKTLTDSDIDEVRQRIVRKLEEEHNAKLRS